MTGVAFVPELVANRPRQSQDPGLDRVIVHQCDAGTFAVPGGNLVVNFGNPFRPRMMLKVLENMRRTKCRKLYVSYKVPSCAELLNGCGFLEALGELPGWPGAYGVQTWRAIVYSTGRHSTLRHQ